MNDPTTELATLWCPQVPLGSGEEGIWGAQFGAEPADIDWLWQGYLARGEITLLTSQWKSGKTTLISILLSRMKHGGAVAGLAVCAGKAVVVSEETLASWRRRHRDLDLGHVYFICLPFRGKPTGAEWLSLIDRLARLHERHSLALVVIDTLTTFLPGNGEANAAMMMEALVPLRRLTEQGVSLLLAHHPAKGVVLPGQAARGSGALTSFTDMNLEMSFCHAADPGDRRRRILAHSRHEATPRHRLIELNGDARDYAVRDLIEDDFGANWEQLHMVLEDAAGKRTRRELLQEWPADFAKPADSTLCRWLRHGVAAGLICHQGTGRRNDPLRYWLPGMEQQWRQDPMYELNEIMEKDETLLAELGRG